MDGLQCKISHYLFVTGAIYLDDTSGTDKVDDQVPPGMKHTYTWSIRQNEAPTSNIWYLIEYRMLPWPGIWGWDRNFVPTKHNMMTL